MLDWFRKPKADKPADPKPAPSLPPSAAPQAPPAAPQAPPAAPKPSSAPDLASSAVGKASPAPNQASPAVFFTNPAPGEVSSARNLSSSAAGEASSAANLVSSAVGKASSAAEIAKTTAETHKEPAGSPKLAAEIAKLAAETTSPTAGIAKSTAEIAKLAAGDASPTAGGGKLAAGDPKLASAHASPPVPAAGSTPALPPDRPAKLPPNIAESTSTAVLPRDDVKLQPPHIAVTVPASAVASLPADKAKTAPSAPPVPGRADLPVGQTPAPASEAKRAGDASKAPAASTPPTDAQQRVPTSAPAAPAAAPKAATWKNLPAKDPWCPPAIAAQAPELRKVAAADAIAFERVLPGWRAAGASRRGRMHANGGTHREDSLAFDAHDRATVLCVSDGAGSCQHSRIGSHIAAQRVVEFLLAATERVDPAIASDATKLKELLKARVTEAVLSATDALLDLAKKSGCSPKDFRCTLLTALHYRGESHELLLTNQIGDGAICLLRTDKTTARLGASDSGTHSGEVSCFVPDDCARVKAKAVEVISDVAPIECVLLCSDGIEDPFYPLEKQAADIFRQFYTGVDAPLKDFKSQISQPAPLLQESAAWGLAQWLEFEKRGENDDRTVAALHRLPVKVSF